MACDDGNPCERQCLLLAACDVREDVELCTAACRAMQKGKCEAPGCVANGPGDPRACADSLLETNREASGDGCTPAFRTAWCDVYFDSNACRAFDLGSVTCR
jgi:hypothetical protein